MDSNKKRTPRHHRLTLETIVQDYREGLITPKGAVFYTISASAPPGYPITLSPQHLCKLFPISKSSYYNAIAALKLGKRLEFVADGTMQLWVPVSNDEGIPDYIFFADKVHDGGQLSTMVDSDSMIVDSNSTTMDSNSMIVDSNSTTMDSNSTIVENQLSKVFPRKRYRASTTRSTRSTRSARSTTTTKHPTHPPVVVEQIEQELSVKLTTKQKEQVGGFSEEQIKQAIAVVRSTAKVKDKKKLFFKALRSGYEPVVENSAAAADFRAWFDAAQLRGLVVASQQVNGQIQILLSDGEWVSFEEAKQQLRNKL
ncbi:hypothetical protein [Pantanalinema sp. GBBB05]|uniref:hypothetical protein n=1 Tax=Pantanalinema sp. GBBB05 TaxID=2604139 RepID=UPI001DDA3EF1|nr:hypothetical protein [Pantanalinema sp. GBBB05]